MSLHTDTYLAIVRKQSEWALYNRSLDICFFLYKNLSSCFQQYKLPVQYTLTPDASYASPKGEPVGSYIVTVIYLLTYSMVHSPS